MKSLSQWALPPGQCIELNRDEYSRVDFGTRTTAYKTLIDTAIEVANATGDKQLVAGMWDMIASMERFHGTEAGASLTGNKEAALGGEYGPSPTGGNNGSRIGYPSGR
jgi:hypothetical protein